ncbi:hypothetical protein [Nocardioides solisilvae]|uniref:hypothetical protein n=1 Tax=Nocardioides solisilvae TaxID=1542435 RepID=UPI000D74A462|nr:hypothetical protein [Nocardioides solisilvae]
MATHERRQGTRGPGEPRVRCLRSLAVLPLLWTGACSPGTGGDDAGAPAASPAASPSIRTLEPLPAVDDGPPEGELVAELLQSSRDAAAGRFQVWVGNGTDRPLRLRSVRYLDWRYFGPLDADRVRPVPAGSERGFLVALPSRPRCAPVDRPPAVELRVVRPGGRSDGTRTRMLDVSDEADVVARHVASRCFELDLRRDFALSVDDRVQRVDEKVAELTLRVRPRGRPGGAHRRLDLRSVSGTPVLTPYRRPVWRPGVTVTGHGDAVAVPLRVAPARCDGHAVAESGGATAFRVRMRLDGRRGELLVRMTPRGAARALRFAAAACGR